MSTEPRVQTPCISVMDENGQPKILYSAWPKQLEYHEVNKPNVLLFGGRGSGKSLCGRWDCHMRALAHPGFNYCILRRTYPELEKSHLIHIGYEMRMLGGTFNQTFKTAHYSNGSRGFFAHCQSDEDVLKLLSSEFALMFFDELSTFQWEQFTKLAASCRVPVGSGLYAMVRAATNPLGPSAQEILKYFVTKEVDPEEDQDYNPDDWYSIRANIEDNPSLDRSQYQKRFAGLPAHVRKAWVDGEFIMENALFDFRPTQLVTRQNSDGETITERIPYHVVDQLDLAKVIKTSQIYRAVDSGWFPDPSVCLWIAHLGTRFIVIKEITEFKHTAAQFAAKIKQGDEELAAIVDPDHVLKISTTYCDPTMDINTPADIKTVKEIYEANGIPMECSINNREHFALSMHNALAEEARPGVPRLQIYSKGCPMLIRTIPAMAYDDKHPARMADHKHDHWVVACCYFLMTHSTDARGAFASEKKPKRWMMPKVKDRWVLGTEGIREIRG